MYQASKTQRNRKMDIPTRMANAHAMRLDGLSDVSGWPRIMKNNANPKLPMMARNANVTSNPMRKIIQ